MKGKEEYLDWKKIIILSLSTTINIPVINIGHSIGSNAGLLKSFIIIIVANFILTSLMTWVISISFSLRKNTIEAISSYFNKSTTKIFSTILFVSACIWFAIQLQAVGAVISKTMEISTPTMCNLFLGISFALCLQHDLKRTLLLSNYTAFLSLSFLFYFFYQTFTTVNLSAISTTSQTSIVWSLQDFIFISIALNGAFLAAIDMPNYFRHGKSKKETLYTIAICFGIILSTVEILGVLIAIKYPQMSITESLQILTQADQKVFFLFFIFLSGCCINNVNLHSGVLSLKNLFPKLEIAQQTLITGFIGTILSCFDVHQFKVLMNYKVIIVATMTAVICIRAQQLLKKPNYAFDPANKKLNVIIAIISILFGIASEHEILHLTGSATIDSFICAFTLSLLFTIFPHVQSYYKKLSNKKYLPPYPNISNASEEKICDSVQDSTTKIETVMTP